MATHPTHPFQSSPPPSPPPSTPPATPPATPSATPVGYRSRARPAILAVIITLTFFLTLAWATQPKYTATPSSNILPALFLLFTQSFPVVLWLLPAFGFGRFITVRLLKQNTHAFSPISFAVGSAFLLFLDHALGTLALLQLFHNTPTYALTILGSLLLFIPQSNIKSNINNKPSNHAPRLPLILLIVIAILITIPITIILTAALSSPGYLWDSEFGGFDALSYHLQLPREWLALGKITPLNHNIYSFLPSYMEAAYYQLAILAQPFTPAHTDPVQYAAVAAQLLHASFTIITAAALAQLLTRITRIGKLPDNFTATLISIILAASFIALPWVTVVGSLAYNEIPTILFFIAALLLILDNYNSILSKRILLTIGFLLGSACAVKLTSFGLITVPVITLFIITQFISNIKLPRIILNLAVIALAAFFTLLPYALRNFIATDYSNPIFPFATSIFGSAGWTAEQISRFKNAHIPGNLTLIDRLNALWQMAFLNTQWSYLFFIAPTLGLIALTIRKTRLPALACFLLLITQLLYWLFFTHLQSRFLLPASIPLIILIALPLLALTNRKYNTFIIFIIPTTIAVLIFLGILTGDIRNYTTQRNGSPAAMIDALPFYTGENLPQQVQNQLAENNPFIFLNINKNKLKPGLIYLLGDSTPFYLNTPYLYNTTWDSSPLGNVIRNYPDNPNEWAQKLTDDYHIRYILINYSELARLIKKDHWYDPAVTLQAVRQLQQIPGIKIIKQWPPNYELMELPPSTNSK